MKYRIPIRDELSREEKRRRTIKWLLLVLSLLMLYTIMRAGIFDAWQPVFIIPLAVAVSMYESELASCVFALLSGYMIDIASGFIFGFSVIWLMPVCLVETLLVRNLIRVHLANFWFCTLAATVLECSMNYLFNVFIWNIPGGDIILTHSIIPTAAATVITAPIVYFWVKFIELRLGSENETIELFEEAQEEDTGEKD